jgi:fibronectin-binding autotransporter adhesin
MENDSTNPAICMPNLLWRMGGGGTHIYDFKGTGDWIVYNYMRNDNNAGSGVMKDGPGTLYWYGTNVPAASQPSVVVNGGLVVNGGTVYLKTFDLLTSSGIQLDPSGFGGTMTIYDAALTNSPISQGGAGNISGTLSGSGPFMVNQGRLSLSGNNTYSGTNYLVGGEVIANRAENVGSTGPLGQNGVITFRGGTLGYSSANTFDYSARFDTSPNQAFSIDVPSGLTVAFSNALVSSGGTLTKIGGGTLILAGTNTFNGITTVGAGKLVIQGQNGPGPITVADGQTLGVFEDGLQDTPSSLTLGTTAGVTLEFNNVTNTSLAPIAVTGGITAAGPITVNITSGKFKTIGQSFPLVSWTTGSAPAFNNPPTVNGAAGTLSVVGNSLMLTISATPYTWTGGTSGFWDTSTSGNWQQSGNSVNWQNNVLTLFDDSASGNPNIAITGDLQPASVTVNNSAIAYSITSSSGNIIDGSGGLTKLNNGTLTLSGGVNNYTGVTTVGGGNLVVNTLANGGAVSDIGSSGNSATNLVLNGGTLQYVGAAANIDRQFSLGTSGGTLDASGAGALALTSTKSVNLSGSGAHALSLQGNLADTNTLSANLGDSSAATTLTKNGLGTWILLGTNTYTGVTTIHNGVLQIGNGGGSGTIGSGAIVNNASLDFNTTGTNTVNGAISGSGSVTNDGTGTLILANNNSYSGATVNNVGTLQIGNGGGAGSLTGGLNLINNGLVIFNSTANSFYNGSGIHGTGNVIIARGTVKAVGGNDYTGWTQINSGATFTPDDNNTGNAAILATSVITNNGTLRLEGYTTRNPMYANIVGSGKVQVGGTGGIFDAGDQTLGGTNTYTGGTFIGGEHLVLGDGVTPGAGSIVGNVTFVNNFEDANDNVRRLIFNRPDDFIFSGNIVTNFATPNNNQGIVNQNGNGNLILTGNNTYGSGTVVNAGTLTVGNGGSSGTLGFGGITLTAGTLNFNRAGTLTIPGVITGGGNLVQEGTGTTILVASNTFFGPMTISNGVLVVSATGGDINLLGGALAAGSTTVPTNLFVAGSLNLTAGNVMVTLNKSLVQSNSFFTVNGAYNYTGSGLVFNNAGPSLAVGDRFVIFSQPISGAHTMPIVSPYFTLRNDIETDGSVTVTSISQPLAPTLNPPVLLNGSNIVISATNNAGNNSGTYTLYNSTNIATPLTNWSVLRSGTFDGSGNLFVTNSVGKGASFFILRVP